MGIERRKYRRVDASSVIWYEIKDLKKMSTDDMHVDIGLPQRSVDISLGGARIFTTTPIDPDKNLKVILSIPKVKEPISIAAKVVWCQRYPADEKYYMVGLQFMEYLNNMREQLSRYIDTMPDMP
jgi:c-di-GMP-binding flagellar brake protein YcgR